MQTDLAHRDFAYLNAAIARCNKLLVRKLSLSAQIELMARLDFLRAQICAA